MATQEQRQARAPQLGGKPGEDHMAEANALVNGDRQASYGPPGDSYRALAKTLSGLLASKLHTDLTAEDIALVMVALKMQRQMYRPKRDNVVDAHGYLLVLAHIMADRANGEEFASLEELYRRNREAVKIETTHHGDSGIVGAEEHVG